jgi:hypothetical protein
MDVEGGGEQLAAPGGRVDDFVFWPKASPIRVPLLPFGTNVGVIFGAGDSVT